MLETTRLIDMPLRKVFRKTYTVKPSRDKIIELVTHIVKDEKNFIYNLLRKRCKRKTLNEFLEKLERAETEAIKKLSLYDFGFKTN